MVYVSFGEGLATVLSFLGLSATFAGKVMGGSTAGTGLGTTLLPVGASVFAIAMGLNVLELLKFDLPSFEGGLDFITSLPRNTRAYMLGESLLASMKFFSWGGVNISGPLRGHDAQLISFTSCGG